LTIANFLITNDWYRK